jgi:hypothetical protein
MPGLVKKSPLKGTPSVGFTRLFSCSPGLYARAGLALPYLLYDIWVSSDRTAGIYFGELKMMKKRAFTLVVILAFWCLPTPAPAAPVLAGHQPPAAGEQLVERVLTWLRQRLPEAPKPQKTPPVSRKCRGTIDPDGLCKS